MNVRAFSGLNPFFSLGTIALEWLLIAIAVISHHTYPSVWLYVPVWLLIGTRMYALYSLLHDGIHFLLHPNKRVNDVVSIVFLAAPLFISLSKIRQIHFSHHLHLKTHEDPEHVHLAYSEFQFPKPWSSLFFIFLLDITGINFIHYKIKKGINFFKKINLNNRREVYAILFFALKVSFVILLIYLGLWKAVLWYWIIPYITIYQFLNRLRLSSEHISVDENNVLGTRTLKLNFVERFLLSPNFLGYHTEHHLFPSVPFYKLPKLHKKLMEEEAYKSSIHLDHSYYQVIKYFIKKSNG